MNIRGVQPVISGAGVAEVGWSTLQKEMSRDEKGTARFVERSLGAGVRTLAVDVSECEPLDSATIAAVMRLLRTCRSHSMALMLRFRTSAGRRYLSTLGVGVVQTPRPRSQRTRTRARSRAEETI